MRTLRVAHIADTHLGYRSSTLARRNEDFANSWKQACREIVAAKPDLIVHAGDVFHRPNPSWASVIDFLEGASILKQANVPILIISGNHDSSRLVLKHSVFSVLKEAVPFITVSYDPEPIICHLPEIDVEAILLSHQALLNPGLADLLLQGLDLIDYSKHTILVAHGGVGDLEEYREQGAVVIPDFVFEYPWAYIALGHLHIAQPFGVNGWYSGSIERCGWSDFPASPGWTLTTLSNGRVRHEQRDLPHLPMIQLPELDCSSDEDLDIIAVVLEMLSHVKVPAGRAVARIKLNGIHPYIRRSIQFSLKRVIRQIHPDLVFQVEVDSILTRWADPAESPGGDVQSAGDMFRDFVGTRVFDDPTMSAKLLEKGLAAIEKVRAAQFDDEGL